MNYADRLDDYIRLRVRLGSRPKSAHIEDLRRFADWLDSHSKPARACPLPTREGDEYVCRACFVRWDANEDKPECRS